MMRVIKQPARMRPIRNERGLGIIEVLVALVVVSLGVLGMASLQLTGMKHSTGGYHRAKAMLFAADMAARMRINVPGVNASSYDGQDSNGVDCTQPPDPYCQATVGSDAETCTSAELATFDLFSLACGSVGSGMANQGVKDVLPDGRFEIDCVDDPCTPVSLYTIDVSWAEGALRGGTDDAPVVRRVHMRLRP